MKNLFNFINNKILKNKKLLLVCAVFTFLLINFSSNAYAGATGNMPGLELLGYLLNCLPIIFICLLINVPFFISKPSKYAYIIPTILNMLVLFYILIKDNDSIGSGSNAGWIPLIFACICCFFACDKKIVSILFVIIPILLFIFFIEILSPQLKTMRINNIMKIIKTKNIDKFKNIKKNKKDKSIAKDYLYAQVERGDKTFFDFLSAEDINDYQLLYRAVYIAKRDMMQYFIEKGADVNVKYEAGKTPLHLVENKEIVKLLIAKGANVNAKDNGGETPLHNASEEEIVELLIAKGANVNAKNNGGKTPLHYASYYKRHKKIVELLIAKGADVNAKDEDGRTPLDFAEDEKMKQLLISHGAKSGKDLK